ncbi:hypothetical protein CR194_08405 [Salipaludibacillus keqinensis]|uniref:Uncharacterized protein n=1 Tax=Salipaludibacillus keqinensis TaxID=2045207 RepID=A0A323TDK2_9BACI|nr:hypothetical protein CR194_08405 [Salipaludibacillus keqinensis]
MKSGRVNRFIGRKIRCARVKQPINVVIGRFGRASSEKWSIIHFIGRKIRCARVKQPINVITLDEGITKKDKQKNSPV